MPAEQLFPQQAGAASNDGRAAAADTSSSGAADSSSSSSVVPGLSAELQAALDLTNSYRRWVRPSGFLSQADMSQWLA
jgi:hypothetical protein